MIEHVPDRIWPIVGWRGWIWTERGLESLFFSTEWPAGSPLEARCRARHDPPDWIVQWQDGWEKRHPPTRPIEIPSETCGCGIYALKDREAARNYVETQVERGNVVVGRVALWGRVLCAELGWRAEFAYPQSVFVSETEIDKVRLALLPYRVPVLPWSEIFEEPRRIAPAA